MSPPRLFRAGLLLSLGLAGALTAFAYKAGGDAFTKRLETVLRAEPRALAEESGRLGYARKVKIEEVRGSWLLVSERRIRGWVFAGNLTDTKPADPKGTDGLGLAASKTTATAAARPLTAAAATYAETHDLMPAGDDLNWLLEQCAQLTPAELDAFLQEHRKGEYQE